MYSTYRLERVSTLENVLAMYKAADVHRARGVPSQMQSRYERSRQATLERMAAIALEMRRKVEVFLKLNPEAVMKQANFSFMANVRSWKYESSCRV